MRLGKNIAAFRKIKGFTQEKLAELCNVSRQAVTKWESGESEPSIDKLIVLSKVFNVKIDTLIRAEKDNPLQIKNDREGVDFGFVERCIGMLRNAKYLDCQYGEDTKNRLLSYLFKTLRDKYINEGGQVKEKYLICNTKPRLFTAKP